MIREGFPRHKGVEGMSKKTSEYYKRFQENASFYHLSGDPELTQRDFERYEKSQERVQKETPTFIVEGLKHGDLSARLGMIEVLAQAPEDQRETLQEYVIPTILETLRLKQSENEKEELSHYENKRKALMLIPQISEQQRFHLFKKIFQDKNIEISPNNDIVKLINTFPENEQEKIRKELFKRLKQDINDEDILTRWSVITMIEIAPKTDQLSLIEQALQDRNVHLRCEVVKHISRIQGEDKQRLFEQTFNDREAEVRTRAAKEFCRDIWKAPKIDRPKLIEQARQIQNSDLSTAIEKYISLGLLDTDFKVDLDDHSVTLETSPKDSDQTQYAQDLIKYLTQTNPELLQQWKTLAQITPLYKDVQEPFFVKPFSKTGSGTTLLDQGFVEGHESLRNRAIIRHIDVGPYQGWKRAYEDVEFWKNHGFDYVPVEPIVKATLNPQTYRVDVVTRVFPAPSVAIWNQNVELYTQAIDEQVEKIKKALEALGVDHGHTHEDNFIVYFDRDEHGEPILENPPKVYVIDFDRAISSKK